MWKYVLKRIGLAIVTAFIILSLTFILFKILPFEKPIGNDDVKLGYYLNEERLGNVISFKKEMPQLGAYLFFYSKGRTRLYFYQAPLFKQYYSWLYNFFIKGDWGVSLYLMPNVSATVIMWERLKVSIPINIIATLFSVPLGILLGIIAALKKNKTTDNVISTSIMVFISVPSFVFINVLILVLAYKLKWVPYKWPSSSESQKAKVLGYIIPVLSLSFGSICGYARFTRAELCEVMESDYLLLARTKGLTKKQAIIRHALKNAMVPILPSILAEFIGIFGGSMILEQLYCIPGFGGLYLDALGRKDYNIVFADMTIFTIIGLLAGVFLDLSYGFIDPRIRMGAK